MLKRSNLWVAVRKTGGREVLDFTTLSTTKNEAITKTLRLPSTAPVSRYTKVKLQEVP